MFLLLLAVVSAAVEGTHADAPLATEPLGASAGGPAVGPEMEAPVIPPSINPADSAAAPQRRARGSEFVPVATAQKLADAVNVDRKRYIEVREHLDLTGLESLRPYGFEPLRVYPNTWSIVVRLAHSSLRDPYRQMPSPRLPSLDTRGHQRALRKSAGA